LGKVLWKPSEERVREANMTKFINYVNKAQSLTIDSYWQLYEWSTKHIPDFWATLWQFVDIKFSRKYDEVADDLGRFPGVKWFPGSRLNFAENLLRHRDDRSAIVFKDESQQSVTTSYAELYEQVARLVASLRDIGLAAGDRVCGYMPNFPDTIIAMLASTSLGAIWSSCGADLGPVAVIDRFAQIEPKVLFTVDGYYYKGKAFDISSNVEKIAKGLSSLKKVVIVPHLTSSPKIETIPNGTLWNEFLSADKRSEIRFEQLAFNHPVYIMFSSGTTGQPKCLVQGAGGVLLNHLKELILHTDLKQYDRITYITSPSWMMWNWLISSLAVGATIMLYDGNPNHPDWHTIWNMIDEEKLTILGCSATYLNSLRSAHARPGEAHNLSSLREISQTGSTLSADSFEWVYHEIKNNLHFNSISGGTDINGCFAIGNPTISVYAGELQCPGLGMKISAYDDAGKPVFDREGELVCEAPTPSMPLFFWNDPGSQRYLDAYFSFYKPMGKNVWRHGDYIVLHSDTHGVTFLGRSDSVLKPSGVRIGTSEIYAIIEKLPQIVDSLAVGRDWEGDQRVILFVQLAPEIKLTDELKVKIRRVLRENASPRHVPALILQTPSIPYTFNMKKVESAVRNIINGKPVTNRDALTNPESLLYYERIADALRNE